MRHKDVLDFSKAAAVIEIEATQMTDRLDKQIVDSLDGSSLE
jgi:hypothetical protein